MQGRRSPIKAKEAIDKEINYLLVEKIVTGKIKPTPSATFPRMPKFIPHVSHHMDLLRAIFYSTNHKSSNGIELSQLDHNSTFTNLTWTHPLTLKYTHPMGGEVSPQTIKFQTELNYLNLVKIYLIFSDLTWPYPLTHTITHQYT